LIANALANVRIEHWEKIMKAFAVVCLAVICPVSAFAGNIFGHLSENRQPVKAAEVTVTCGSNSYQTQTDDDGSYSIRADEPGRCMLSVKYKDQTAETEVFSYDQPTRYDFELVMADGKYTLKKK
jgi:Carboxypeptidase regulatory-like domain